ncbi:hypothetical protein GCM10020369_46770 [Cryptosporangium minutisporangium]|uniref:Uncharacterized protein n=1 Tax=Cryptosporangium minutisporangium TaxID=113569 RepID=A0ABP6T1Q4_9ACTN
MAPPGMPKTTSAPTASRERTSDWAPVTDSWAGGVAGAFMAWPLRVAVRCGAVFKFSGNKKPLVPVARGVSASTRCWVDALAEYENQGGSHVGHAMPCSTARQTHPTLWSHGSRGAARLR